MKIFSEVERDYMDGMVKNADFIPLISKDEEEFLLTDDSIPTELPILPIRDNVLFPGVILPVAASKKRSVKLLKEASRHNLRVGVIAQRNDVDDPEEKDLYPMGTVARVLKVFDLPNGTTMGVVQGVKRFALEAITGVEPYYNGIISLREENMIGRGSRQYKSELSEIRKLYTTLLRQKDQNQETAASIKGIGSDRILINYIASHLEIDVQTKQSLLEIDNYEARMMMLIDILNDLMSYIDVREEVSEKAKSIMDRQQREYYLNQQMRVIQDELGGSPSDQDVEELRARGSKKKWNKEVAETFEKELTRLQRYQPQSPDYSVQYNYLDLMLELPWNEYSKDDLRTDHARKVLDKDHYGIEKVKERILEHIAVLSLKKNMKSPILCLVGPPGTGKTSLGKSIASAMGRKYVRVALGGLHDEAEVRGHRRTYVGAMPGRILQGIKKAGTANPVFILDEIDKVQTNTFNGDPTSALLEVLDPEQNNAFHDNYLDLDFDLSNVMFIATANSLSTIQPALLDRMEVIELSGYILEEKLEIASRHLIPRQLSENGFRKGALKFSDEVLTTLISEYTRESGVRQLEKVIAKIVRRRAVDVASGKEYSKNIEKEELKGMLGLPIHTSEHRGKESKVGVVTGLAWTSVGGEILFVEASTSKGKGTLSMTGNLGDVMKESATLAFEYLKANAGEFGVDNEIIENSNIHIHVPEGATPKDGPSAGITIFVAMLSAFTHRKVKATFAMTGEITLRGAVTPVGGIKEKILAAKRAEITDIVLSAENRRDIEDINADYLKGLKFHYIEEMKEALPLMFDDQENKLKKAKEKTSKRHAK
ncbi:MAG: endopeptidase La [Bacteroidales bacterium]|nr:endopeptidase La [Bacteroidales bacterium]